MKVVIRNQNKLKLLEAMGKPPAISGTKIAKQLGVHPVTVHRWMQEPNDEQTKRMMDAIDAIRAKAEGER